MRTSSRRGRTVACAIVMLFRKASSNMEFPTKFSYHEHVYSPLVRLQRYYKIIARNAPCANYYLRCLCMPKIHVTDQLLTIK